MLYGMGKLLVAWLVWVVGRRWFGFAVGRKAIKVCKPTPPYVPLLLFGWAGWTPPLRRQRAPASKRLEVEVDTGTGTGALQPTGTSLQGLGISLGSRRYVPKRRIAYKGTAAPRARISHRGCAGDFCAPPRRTTLNRGWG